MDRQENEHSVDAEEEVSSEEAPYSNLVTLVLDMPHDPRNSGNAIRKLEDELEKEKRKQNEEKMKYKALVSEVEALEAGKAKVEAELKGVLEENKSLRTLCSETCQNLNRSANEAMIHLREIINFSDKMMESSSRKSSEANVQHVEANTDVTGESYGVFTYDDDGSSCKDNLIEILLNNTYDLERQIEAITNMNASNDTMLVLVDEWKEMRAKASQAKKVLSSTFRDNKIS